MKSESNLPKKSAAKTKTAAMRKIEKLGKIISAQEETLWRLRETINNMHKKVELLEDEKKLYQDLCSFWMKEYNKLSEENNNSHNYWKKQYEVLEADVEKTFGEKYNLADPNNRWVKKAQQEAYLEIKKLFNEARRKKQYLKCEIPHSLKCRVNNN
ncbi:MAG TPA: hypothetical protein VH396_10010 [Chitinophagaceae bacterium]|jgi:hypothetical protein